MAHFAKIEDGVVRQIIVVNNSELLDMYGVEDETIGIAFCKSLYGEDTEWVQTSYNNNIRGKFAGLNDTWDGTNFVSPEAQSDGS
jgi:hypothetical protein